MNIFKKIFGSNKYKYNHCFLFYGLNKSAFQEIENQVQQFDGPDHLSLLRSMEGVCMTALCEQDAGSEKVKEAIKSEGDLKTFVDQRLEQYTDKIKENFDSQIAKDCVELINLEKGFVVDVIGSAMKVWAESKFFKKEDFIGAMIVFVRSSKEFDRKDPISENQDGMNLPLVTSNGFIRDCIYATEDVMNIKYNTFDMWPDNGLEGSNPRNKGNYVTPFLDTPFGFSYFDQDGQLWRICDVGKAVTLASEHEEEFVDPDEDPFEKYVTH